MEREYVELVYKYLEAHMILDYIFWEGFRSPISSIFAKNTSYNNNNSNSKQFEMKFHYLSYFRVRRNIAYVRFFNWNLRFHIKMWAFCSFVSLWRLAMLQRVICLLLFVYVFCCCFVLPFFHISNILRIVTFWYENKTHR